MDTNKFAIPIAIVIAGGLIAGSLYYSSKNLPTSDKQPTDTTQVTAGEIRPVDETDHILGDPNADIVIVEYSDTECPYCKVFHQTLQQVMDEYGPSGKVAWVYRHFPIDGLHPEAKKQAHAAECANDQGGSEKFWQYLNQIYARTKSNNGLPSSELGVIAKDVGLDTTTFNSCMDSGKFYDKITAHYNDAVAAGGEGTPFSVMITKKDGKKIVIPGAQPFASVKANIDILLK